MKKQSEIPGYELPSIPKIDEKAIAFLEANKKRAQFAELEKQRKEELVFALREFESDLERDGDGQLVYRYQDGEQWFVCKLGTTEKLQIKAIARSEVEEGSPF